MIDFTLTDEQQMLIEMTHDFVEKEMLPHEETLERTDTLPPKLAADQCRLLTLKRQDESLADLFHVIYSFLY